MANQVNSKRGKPKFIKDGFSYVFDKLSSDKLVQFYRCEQKGRCKARIHVRDGEVITSFNHHSHDATPATIEVNRVKTRIKSRAEESQEPTAQVINHCVQNLSQSAQAIMPKPASLKKIVRRQRNQINAPPPVPASLADTILPVGNKRPVKEEEEDPLINASPVSQDSSSFESLADFKLSPSEANHVVEHREKPAEQQSIVSFPTAPTLIGNRKQHDAFGEHVAEKLRSMPMSMVPFCQKLINDAIFLGEMQSLDISSRIITDPCPSSNLDN